MSYFKQKHLHSAIPEQRMRADTLYLTSNPLKWSVNEVVKFLRTTDCAHLARLCKEQVWTSSWYTCMYKHLGLFQERWSGRGEMTLIFRTPPLTYRKQILNLHSKMFSAWRPTHKGKKLIDWNSLYSRFFLMWFCLCFSSLVNMFFLCFQKARCATFRFLIRQ